VFNATFAFERYAYWHVQQRQPAVNHAVAGHANDTKKTMIYKLTAALQTLLKRLRAQERYHPERHYMRGPGPKARAVAAGRPRH
jgi:hypothetical protein